MVKKLDWRNLPPAGSSATDVTGSWPATPEPFQEADVDGIRSPTPCLLTARSAVASLPVCILCTVYETRPWHRSRSGQKVRSRNWNAS